MLEVGWVAGRNPQLGSRLPARAAGAQNPSQRGDERSRQTHMSRAGRGGKQILGLGLESAFWGKPATQAIRRGVPMREQRTKPNSGLEPRFVEHEPRTKTRTRNRTAESNRRIEPPNRTADENRERETGIEPLPRALRTRFESRKTALGAVACELVGCTVQRRGSQPEFHGTGGRDAPSRGPDEDVRSSSCARLWRSRARWSR